MRKYNISAETVNCDCCYRDYRLTSFNRNINDNVHIAGSTTDLLTIRDADHNYACSKRIGIIPISLESAGEAFTLQKTEGLDSKPYSEGEI